MYRTIMHSLQCIKYCNFQNSYYFDELGLAEDQLEYGFLKRLITHEIFEVRIVYWLKAIRLFFVIPLSKYHSFIS